MVSGKCALGARPENVSSKEESQYVGIADRLSGGHAAHGVRGDLETDSSVS
jgi:hypothetical protein